MSNTKATNSEMEKTRKRVIADYKKGLKPKELSEKYGLNVNTVKSWISRHKSKSTSSESGASVAPAPRSVGAPAGNINGIGNDGGAPVGNTNALKHGGYSKIYWGSLSEKEKELVDTEPDDPEQGLIDQIHLLTVREYRLMERIKFFSELKGNLAVDSVLRTEDKRQFDSSEDKELYNERVQAKVDSGERMPGRSYHVQTRTDGVHNIILRMEEALTRCQDQKRRVWEALWKLRSERGDSNDDSMADDWVAAVMAAEEGEDGEE